MRDVYLTPAGRKRLADRIHATRAAYLARSAENPDALQSGDSSGWHDNFAFEENMRQMHQLARQVRDLEDLLLRVIVVRPPKDADRVVLGARVTWSIDEQEPATVVVAGHDDGDPSLGRVAYDTPFLSQLVGACVGDVRVVKVGGRERTVEILAIEAAKEERCEAA